MNSPGQVKLLFDRDLGAPRPGIGEVAVIGFGSQGRAQAENLRDSGAAVTVGLRSGSPSREKADRAGFRVLTPREAAESSKIVSLLVPDEEQEELYREQLAPVMKPGSTLLFSHGYAVHFGFISPRADIDVVMAAPKGPGHQVREEYRRGHGVVVITAVHQNASGEAGEKVLSYASAIGGGRAGIIESTFKEECETDLFGEQAVICGGLSQLITAGFETLVEAGYPPELAYFECLHEVKFVADLIHRRGIPGMREVISSTARYGDLTRGPRIIGDQVREEMKRVLEEIRSGRFAREWNSESRTGGRRAVAAAAEASGHPLERVGAKLRRGLFPDTQRD
jgi:ketol-acid reductoisomerase